MTEPVVYAVCPAGHRAGSVKPTGTMIKCQQCFRETGQTVTVMVPPRPPEPPPKLEVNWGHDECRTCGDTAPRPGEKLLPVGWMAVMIGTDPAADKYGRTRIYVGSYCGARCTIAALQARTGGHR